MYPCGRLKNSPKNTNAFLPHLPYVKFSINIFVNNEKSFYSRTETNYTTGE